ncbi:hypothetical protein D1AOALGA4SA_3331 [Olavius algarvensis Delta 1 endosymbiont]|nr:hypothetical protein D1AOALGA4SA_3331 [Olavius algarvensis Delta 1 endosymbiont]
MSFRPKSINPPEAASKNAFTCRMRHFNLSKQIAQRHEIAVSVWVRVGLWLIYLNFSHFRGSFQN